MILSIFEGFAYYVLVSLAIHPFTDWVGRHRTSRVVSLSTLFAAYVFLPAAVFPHVVAQTFLVVGCELALSAYSYCAETSSGRMERPPIGHCLFFLFVNPTIVYTAKGYPQEAEGSDDGISRVMFGVLVMLVNVALLRPLTRHARAAWPPTLSVSDVVPFIGYAALRFTTIYAAHSGLASIQIGLARRVGWVVPERYRYPFLATSPLDFWRRWNTYVRIWLEAYVFLPLARHIARHRTRHPAGQIFALAITLVASGLIHGAVAFAQRPSVTGFVSPMQFFLLAAALVATWELARRALGAGFANRKVRPSSGRVDVGSGFFSRLLFASVVLVAATRWG